MFRFFFVFLDRKTQSQFGNRVKGLFHVAADRILFRPDGFGESLRILENLQDSREFSKDPMLCDLIMM